MIKYCKSILFCLLFLLFFTKKTSAQTSIVQQAEVYVKVADTSAMLANYLRKSDTANMLTKYARLHTVIKYSDSSSMLRPYLRKWLAEETYATKVSMALRLLLSDTTAMLNGYARKDHHTLYSDTAFMLAGYSLKGHSVQYSDTVSMLSPYLLSSVAAGTYATQTDNSLKVNYTDTAAMLIGYSLRGQTVQYSDTVSMLSPYLLSSVAAGTYATQTDNSLKVNYTDTAAMLSGYSLRGQTVQYSDTVSMLSPYLLSSVAAGTYATQANNSLKVNYTDTAAMLSGYSLRGRTVQYSDTVSMLSPYLLSSEAAGTYATQVNNSLKVNYTDTAAMLSGYSLHGRTVQYSDTVSMLSPYLLSSEAAGTYATQANAALKLNSADTTSMLQGYLKLISNDVPVMGGATMNGILNGREASFSNTVHLARNSGAVVVGNVNPASHKLAVDGSIGARKVVVNSPENWADYVFADDYSLRSLDEVEAFIKRNKHLPDVPSEKEVKQKGIDVADMQAVLLRKIEELTLYILKQNAIILNHEKLLNEIIKNSNHVVQRN